MASTSSDTLDTAPPTIEEGTEDDLLRVTPGSEYGVVELVTFDLLFEEGPGDPLSTLEASDLVAELAVYLDDGSGDFDPVDTLVTSETNLQLADGIQTLSFADDNPDGQIEWSQTKDYWITIRLTVDASTQSPNQFRLTHVTEGGSTAENAPYDTPLVLQHTPNISSGFVTATGSNPLIFADGFESGDSSAWSSCSGC